MVLPDIMMEMGLYLIKMKYPDENRPDVILMLDGDETINFLFTQFEDSVQPEEIEDIIHGIQSVINRMNQGSTFYQNGKIKAKLVDIYWFDYTSVAIDDDVYNIIFAFCLNETLVLGGFCCLNTYRKQWKILVLQMLETLIWMEKT